MVDFTLQVGLAGRLRDVLPPVVHPLPLLSLFGLQPAPGVQWFEPLVPFLLGVPLAEPLLVRRVVRRVRELP